MPEQTNKIERRKHVRTNKQNRTQKTCQNKQTK